jgi:glycerol-3-phosphate dehydrogenase
VIRDLRRLADSSFDLLVIGAGIYGATIAWDATLRGLSVALVDRDDFGSGTSANSLKTVHGGLRSLQRGALPEMREFIRERRTLLRVAPHLVHPLRFVVPTSRHVLRNPIVMRIALLLNDAIASDRNEGVPAKNRLGDGRLVSVAQLRRLAPDLHFDGVVGGASWNDAQMHNSERVTFEFVASAAARGAAVANHLDVESLLARDERVLGARVRDRLTGESFTVRARVTVNAAGPWASSLSATACGMAPASLVPAMSRAINLVTQRPAGPCAVGGLSDGRFFFQVPWRGVTIYGTSHEPYTGAPDAARPGESDVAGLLADVNRAFPGHPVQPDEVSFVHWGLLPSKPGSGPHVQLAKHSLVRDHRRDGVDGLVTVVGVRYTTARRTAERAVDTVFDQLGRTIAPIPHSATTPLQGATGFDADADAGAIKAAVAGLSRADVDRLLRTYGHRALEVARLLHDPSLRTPLGSACPVTLAEVEFAVREEMACTLADVLLRRTEAGTAGAPGEDALNAAGRHAQGLLGWNEERLAAELQAVRERYGWAR